MSLYFRCCIKIYSLCLCIWIYEKPLNCGIFSKGMHYLLSVIPSNDYCLVYRWEAKLMLNHR